MPTTYIVLAFPQANFPANRRFIFLALHQMALAPLTLASSIKIGSVEHHT
jgi:hypothetical protein